MIAFELQENILQTRIIGIDVMHIVGGDELCRILCAHLNQSAIEIGDFFDIVLLEFDEESVRAEDIVIPVHAPDGFFGFVVQQRARNFRGHTAGGADQPFGMSR